MSDQQERKYRRYRLGYPVRLRCQAGGSTAEIDGISTNVSIGGLLVKSASMIPAHTPVTFVIIIPGEQGVQSIYLAGEGRVVRVDSSSAATFGLAVECRRGITQLEDYLPAPWFEERGFA
jgi:PilZ domain